MFVLILFIQYKKGTPADVQVIMYVHIHFSVKKKKKKTEVGGDKKKNKKQNDLLTLSDLCSLSFPTLSRSVDQKTEVNFQELKLLVPICIAC